MPEFQPRRRNGDQRTLQALAVGCLSVSLHTFNIINLLGGLFVFCFVFSYDLGQKQFLPLKHVKYSVITVNIEQYREL